ncbi:MAG: glycoside hydrolase family 16 protein [Promethearchaeota archaeon]
MKSDLQIFFYLGLFFSILVICTSMTVTPSLSYSVATSFYDDFDIYDSSKWFMANGWGNGPPFGCYWLNGQVSFSGGNMIIECEKQSIGGYDYISGEYRTNSFYHYGLYEVHMRPANGTGLMSGSLFTYTGPTDGNPWDEIDIEFLGKNTNKVQFNYFTDGKGGHEYSHDLGFDATQAFHTYAFNWSQNSITWYVDGSPVHTATTNLPSTAGRIMMNLWPGDGSVDGWLGPFDDSILPVTASYDWFRFTPNSLTTESTTTSSSESTFSLTTESTTTSSSESTFGFTIPVIISSLVIIITIRKPRKDEKLKK